MSKLLRLTVLLCACFLRNGGLHAQLIDWAKSPTGTYSFTNSSEKLKMGTDASGNTFLTGRVTGSGSFGSSTLTTAGNSTTPTSFLASYDPAGNARWTRLLDTAITVQAIAVDASGSFYISGGVTKKEVQLGGTTLTPSNDYYQSLLFLAKYDAQGICQWAIKVADGDGVYNSGYGLALGKNGNLAVIGSFGGEFRPVNQAALTASNNMTADMFIVLCNSAGAVLWANQTRGEANEEGRDVAFDDNGNVYVTGTFSEDESGADTGSSATGNKSTFDNFTLTARKQDIFLAKYDLTGKCAWVQQGGSDAGSESVIEESNGIAVDGEGNSYITGTASYFSTFGSIATGTSKVVNTNAICPFVAKYSPSGTCLWAKSFYSGFSYGYALALKDNSLFVTGTFYGNIYIDGEKLSATREAGSFQKDAFVAKFFTDGTAHWAVRTGGASTDEAFDIARGADNKLYIVGKTINGTFGSTTLKGPLFVARLSDDANIISGRVFKDSNNNGAFDSGELPAAKTVVELLPGPIYAITNDQGVYRTYVREGSYSINVSQPPLYHTTTTAHTAAFTTMGNTDGENDFPLQGQANVTDGTVNLYGSYRVRPGFESAQTLTYQNKGTIAQNGTLELTLDPNYEYLESTPAATVNGSKLSWSYKDLQPDEKRTISIKVKLPATIALGTMLSSSASLACEGTDADLSSNTYSVPQLVVGSYDPNDKAVSDTIFSPAQLAASEPLVYTIRFQNKGTAEAIFVTIKDTLSEKLQAGTFEMLGASHPYTVKITDKGALEWHFDNINLPAEMHDEPASHGFIRYRIIPKKELAIGEEIENKAYIYFDFNAPVITNVSTTRIGKHAQTIRFESIADRILSSAPIGMRANSSSRLPVAYQIVSGPATLEGDSLRVSGLGLVTLKALQAGNDNYSATEATVQFCVLPTKPVITSKGMVLTSSAGEGNQWYRNGAAITGASTQSLTVTESGEYTVKATGPCGEGQVSDSFSVTVAGVGVELASRVSLYPNPATTELRLELPPGMYANRITVLTTRGIVVMEQGMSTTSSGVTIPAGGLAKGVYIVSVETTKGTITKKFIKN
jgi:hypothetical protein